MFAGNLLLPAFTINGESLIDFEFIDINEYPKTNWIFFTSKNAVRSFFKKSHDLTNTKIACVGPGTAKSLAKFVQKIHFIGDAVDITTVGKKFNVLLGTETCLFPISNISRRNIQKQIANQNQVFDLIVYKTSPKINIPYVSADVVVFTSPSNAKAFTKTNSFKKSRHYIAMGKSTAEQLLKLGCTSYSTPKSPGEMGIINAIYELI